MPKSPENAIQDLRKEMNQTGRDIITMTWPEFYEEMQRQRMKNEFRSDLQKEAQAHGLLIAYGEEIVAVIRDYNFAGRRR